MKEKVALHTPNYTYHFKQHPLINIIVLLTQLLFLTGWTIYFYSLTKDYIIAINAETLLSARDVAIQTVHYILEISVSAYIFINLSRSMFDTSKQLRHKILILILSLLISCLAVARLFFPFNSDIYTAFWYKG